MLHRPIKLALGLLGIYLGGWGKREGERDIRAIVSMVFRCVGSPCRRTSVTVCTVPVDGAQVMLNGVPAVIDVRVVNVNGF